jgi:hypothetical protein
MNIYYVYQYVRADQTPYYIGKGKNKRAWKSHRRSNGAEIKPKDDSRIQIVSEHLTEKDAFALEIKLIALYGLSSDGGILVNMKYGGQGGTPNQDMRDHMSRVLTGRKKPPRTEEHIRNHAIASEKMKGVPNPKTSDGLKAWYATNPNRSETIAKQSDSLKEWYKTADKQGKAWKTWHTRFTLDYDEYVRAIVLLRDSSIATVVPQVKFHADTLRKIKNQTHGIFNHFPELHLI